MLMDVSGLFVLERFCGEVFGLGVLEADPVADELWRFRFSVARSVVGGGGGILGRSFGGRFCDAVVDEAGSSIIPIRSRLYA